MDHHDPLCNPETVRAVRRRAAGLLVLAGLAFPTAAPALDVSFVVDAATDLPDANPGDGVCAATLGLGCSIRAAVQEAGAGNPADTYFIEVPPGSYGLSQGVALPLAGKVRLFSLGPVRPVIQQIGLDSVVEVQGPGNVFLADLVLRGGQATRGGAVRIVSNGQPTQVDLFRVVLTNNHALERGGAVDLDGGTVSIRDSHLVANVADQFGGGLAAQGLYTLTVERTHLDENASGFEGGGMFLDLANPSSWARLVDLSLLRNDGGFLGGALSAAGDFTTSTGGSVRVVRSLLRENTTASGGSGAGARDGARLDLIACTVSGHHGLGSVMEYVDAPGRISYSTVANSTLQVSSAVTAFGGSSPRELVLHSTVIADSHGGPDLDAFGTGIVSHGWNHVVRTGDFANTTWASSDTVGTVSSPGPDPLLGPLDDHGGGTLTHAPDPASTLHGGSPFFPSDPDEQLDQRGAVRCNDLDGDLTLACGVGAYKLQECEDTIDNDGDSFVDFGSDPHCDSQSDREIAQCSDGADNDEDGSTDHPADGGCTSPDDDNESGACGLLGIEPWLALPLLRAARRRRSAAC
jgi:hypothetical protein